jgi:hypothetical protein
MDVSSISLREPTMSEPEEGLGGKIGRSIRDTRLVERSIRDTRLVERTLRERWTIPEALSGPLIDQLAGIIQAQDQSAGSHIGRQGNPDHLRDQAGRIATMVEAREYEELAER